LKLCGVLAAGETPSAPDAEDAFDTLNTMLDRWKAERLTAYQVQRYPFAIPSGAATRTIGPTGDFVIPTGAPIWIANASSIQNYGVTQTEFEIPITVFTSQQWAEIVTMKTMTNSLPIGIFYQRGAPNGTINFWPVQNVSGIYLALYCSVPLTEFTDRVTDVSLPPGYGEALIYQLALRLAPMFGRSLDPAIVAIASEAIGILKVTNENMDTLDVDEAIAPRASGAWNYRTGNWQFGGGGY
jgi:hypothetical protein